MIIKSALLGVDIQNDFTTPSGSFFVKGANIDAVKISSFIDRYQSSIDYIALTMDTHSSIHVSQQGYWHDSEGYPPPLYSIITADDVRNNIWVPRFNEDAALPYLEGLEQKNEFCKIWPTHCIKGTAGWAINSMVMKSIEVWNRNTRNQYDIFMKTDSEVSENYSIFGPLVQLEKNSSAEELRDRLLNKLDQFDRILVVGQPADLCIVNTVVDMVKLAPHMAKKIYLLTDCMSWINTDNERTLYLFELARQKGVHFIKSTQFESIL